MLKAARLLTAVVALVVTASLAQSAIITGSHSIQEINDELNGEIRVGDKVFSDFTITNASLNTVVPDASAISVTGVILDVNGQTEYGLKFNGGWTALSGQLANTTIAFKVTADDPFLLTDNSLWMTAYGADGGGSVLISENVYRQDPVLTVSESIADKFVYYTSRNAKKTFDHQLFTDPDSGSELALSSVWVIKNITVSGGVNAGGVAVLGEFYQTFSQIPEPATTVMLSLAGGLLLQKRRKC